MAFHGVVKTSSNLSPRPHKNYLQKKLAQVANLIGTYIFEKEFRKKDIGRADVKTGSPFLVFTNGDLR